MISKRRRGGQLRIAWKHWTRLTSPDRQGQTPESHRIDPPAQLRRRATYPAKPMDGALHAGGIRAHAKVSFEQRQLEEPGGLSRTHTPVHTKHPHTQPHNPTTTHRCTDFAHWAQAALKYHVRRTALRLRRTARHNARAPQTSPPLLVLAPRKTATFAALPTAVARQAHKCATPSGLDYEVVALLVMVPRQARDRLGALKMDRHCLRPPAA